MPTAAIAGLVARRLHDPASVHRALAERTRPAHPIPPDGRLFLIAADHPARAALRAGTDPVALENRTDLLHRLHAALADPGVDGVLGTADILEDLAALGALEGKLVFGSMNRGGLAGSAFEADDRFTGYTPAGLAAAGLDGGKMLLRIDPADPATARTLQACAQAIEDVAAAGMVAMVEPFWSLREESGLRNLLTGEATARAAVVAAGLGSSSARTWLKLPAVSDVERVLDATTLPCLLLGGEVPRDPEHTYDTWRSALGHPAAIGIVAGRSMLYPSDGDVTAAVASVAAIVHPERRPATGDSNRQTDPPTQKGPS